MCFTATSIIHAGCCGSSFSNRQKLKGYCGIVAWRPVVADVSTPLTPHRGSWVVHPESWMGGGWLVGWWWIDGLVDWLMG